MSTSLGAASRGTVAAATACALIAVAIAADGASAAAGMTTSPPPQQLAPIHGHYTPAINPSNFVSKVDNPYWPLKPGTGFHFKGVKGTTPQRDDETATHRTKQILGITGTVVRDTVSEASGPVERTFDYYAQDKYGNAWYMGERSLEKRSGHWVTASDSWLAGRDGGLPGIIMPADPKPGDAYRQEYYPPGEALDQARVLSLRGRATVPNGSYRHVLVTSEYSPLEPQTEQKYYVKGLGEVKEKVVKGHHEEFQLVRITH
jgi:hypothetical protein